MPVTDGLFVYNVARFLLKKSLIFLELRIPQVMAIRLAMSGVYVYMHYLLISTTL